MTLYLIGLGLGDEKDITVKGLEIVQRCYSVYLDSYTSILGVCKQNLVCFFIIIPYPIHISTPKMQRREGVESIIVGLCGALIEDHSNFLFSSSSLFIHLFIDCFLFAY